MIKAAISFFIVIAYIQFIRKHDSVVLEGYLKLIFEGFICKLAKIASTQIKILH